MKIGLLADSLTDIDSGMGTHVYNLVDGLSEIEDADLYPILTGGEIEYPIELSNKLYISNNTPRKILSMRKKISENNIDILHSPTGFNPSMILSNTTNILTLWGTAKYELDKEVHLQPATGEKQVFNFVLKNFVDHIITHSDSAKENIIKHFDIEPGDITVIYPGVSEIYKTNNENSVNILDSYGIPDEYILDVSRTQPKKNIPRLIKAYAAARRMGVTEKLVIVGGESRDHSQALNIIEEEGIEEHVLFPGVIRKSHLPHIYSEAKVFCFPSLHEGFGFPIVESMASGTAVITSNRYSCPEVAGEAAEIVDPTSEREIAEAMSKLLNNEGYRGRLVNKGLKRVERFKWEDTVSNTFSVYERLY